MANTGKTAPGPTGHRTVLQLAPVDYKITLIYLGDKRVSQGAGYRCTYTLRQNSAPVANNPDANPVTPLSFVRNVAVPRLTVPQVFGPGGGPPPPGPGGTPVDRRAELAALPISERGDNTDPPIATVFRVVILDNHGLRKDDTDPAPAGGGMLGPTGDPTSKPASYRARLFEEDIIPDVPFRVIIRKYMGGAQVDLTANELANLRVLWEIKDPQEDLTRASNTGARAFLQNFQNSTKAHSASPGDDNAATTFGGKRVAPAAGAAPPATGPAVGIPANQVLFATPFNPQPPVDRLVAPSPPPPPPPPGPPPPSPLENVLTHAQATGTAVTMHDALRAKLTLTRATEPAAGGGTLAVGIADVTFRPPPIGGDDYRFLLKLSDNGGTDVRFLRVDQTGNFTSPFAGGTPPPRTIRVYDEASVQLPRPYCYTTGKFVIWRRTNIRLFVLVNTTPPPPPPPAGAPPPPAPINGGGPAAPTPATLVATLPAGAADFSNAINFTSVQNAYAEGYVEVHAPQQTIRIDPVGWRDLLKKYFLGRIPGVSNATVNRNANYFGYLWNFYPRYLHVPPAAFQPGLGALAKRRRWYADMGRLHLNAICRQVITDTCALPTVNATPPGDSSRQQDTEGYCVILLRHFLPNATVAGNTVSMGLLGRYLPEQKFIMVAHHTLPNAANITLIHEMGHGLYLRHGQTSSIDPISAQPAPFDYTPAGGGAATQINVYSMIENSSPFDHDQGDMARCIMSYDNDNVTTDFCAMCLLVLRYYDRVALRNSILQQITAGATPARTVHIQPPVGAGNARLNETAGNLARGSSIDVTTVTKIEPEANDSGRNAKCIATLNNVTYTVTPAGQGVTVAHPANQAFATVSATATATVSPPAYQVQCSLNGVAQGPPLSITVV